MDLPLRWVSTEGGRGASREPITDDRNINMCMYILLNHRTDGRHIMYYLLKIVVASFTPVINKTIHFKFYERFVTMYRLKHSFQNYIIYFNDSRYFYVSLICQ